MFFVLSFVVVLFLSGYFISNVYNKWSSTPIIISTNPTPRFISTIPFPAVTICSVNQAKRSRVENINPDSLKYILLQSLCANNITGTEKLQHTVGKWSNFRSFIMNVSQPCHEMFIYCKFGKTIEDCSQLFYPILTDDGLCCTFNAVDDKFMYIQSRSQDVFDTKPIPPDEVAIDWTPENGYPKELPNKFYPRIAMGTGTHLGLSVIMNTSTADYFCTTTKSIGFKVSTDLAILDFHDVFIIFL